MSMETNCKLVWKYPPKELKEFMKLNDDKVNLMFAESLKTYADRYTPFRSGVLKDKGAIATKDGLYYNVPYATAQYFGKSYRHQAGRSAEWDKPTVQAHRKDILMRVSLYIQQRGKT